MEIAWKCQSHQQYSPFWQCFVVLAAAGSLEACNVVAFLGDKNLGYLRK